MRKYPYHLITSTGLGFSYSSLTQIGDVLPPDSGLGQANIGLYFNVKTLNVYVEDQMADFVEAGLKLPTGFIYNSANNTWQFYLRRFSQLPASTNDTATLIEADGHETTYFYDSVNAFFIPPRTGQGFPILQFDENNKSWVLYHSELRVIEIYDQQGLLRERRNHVGQKISFEYDAQNNLNKINGYSGNAYLLNRQIKSTATYSVDLILQKLDGSQQKIQHYEFANNLLQTSTRYDFLNNKLTGYITTYCYATDNSILLSILQDDGTQLDTKIIAGNQRSVTLGNRSGTNSDGLSFMISTQENNIVRVTAGNPGFQLDFILDANGQLQSLKRYNGSGTYDENQTEISQYVYNDKNELTQIKHPNNTQETRNFDSIFGFLIEHTHIQNQLLLSKIQFNYEINTKRPQLVSKVTTLSSSPSTVVTRNVYEHKNLNDISNESTFLRYIISPEGRVTANHYADDGYVHEKRAYTGAFYPVDTLKPESVPALTDMEQWEQLQISQMPKAVKIKQYEHDPHGLVRSLKMFADIDVQGNGIENASSSCELLVRDDFGQQTQSQIKIDVKSETDFTPVFTAKNQVYDFMQRLVQVTDELNQQTTHEYIISANVQTIKTTFANKRQETTLLSSLKIPSNIAASAFDASGSTLQHRNTQSTFDPKGRIYQTQLPGGLILYTCFDAQDRINAAVNQSGQFKETIYCNIPNGRYSIETAYANVLSADNLIKMANSYISADVVKNTFFKDQLDPQRDRSRYQFFDGLERIFYEIDAENFVIEYRYDELDRKMDEIHYFDQISTNELSTLIKGDLLTRKIDITKDRWTSYYYDRENLIGTIDPDGWVTEKRYNSAADIIEEIAYATPNRTPSRAREFADIRPAMDKENDAHHFYFYDGKGQVILSVDPESYITQSQYSPDGLIQLRYYLYNKVDVSWYQDTSKFPNLPPVHTEDRTEIFKYDNKRRLTRHYFQYGKGEWIEYDVMDNIVKKKIYDASCVTEKPSSYDYNGDTCRITETQFDGWGQVARVANPFIAAQIAQIQADSSLRPEEKDSKIKVLWINQSLRNEYDDSGLLLSHTNTLGERKLFYYDNNHQLILTIDAEGALVENGYNYFNEIILLRHYLNKIQSTILSTLSGGLISDTVLKLLIAIADDPIESKNYDRRGLVSQTTDGEGYITENYYNAFHEVRETHLPIDHDKKQVVKFTHDPRGNLTQTDKFPVNNSQLNPISIKYKYDNIYSHPTNSFDENNNQTQFYYDRLGNNVVRVDPQNGESHREFDAYDRKINEKNELGYLIALIYSQQDKSITKILPNGSKILITQNIFSEETKSSNAVGCVTTTTHNVNAQIAQVSITVEGKAKVNICEYDTEGKIKFETDPLQIKTEYDYNKAGKLIRKTLDEGDYKHLNVATSFEPDALGRAVTITNPRNVITTQKFNKNNLLIYSVKDPGTTEKPGIGYTETQTYNATGDRTFLMQGDIADPNQYAVEFLFDDYARPIGKIIDPTMPGIDKPLNITEINTLDPKGHVIAHKDPNGNITRYFYDGNDHQRFKINACGGVEEWEFDGHHRKVSYRQYGKIIDTNLLPNNTTFDEAQKIISDQKLKTTADTIIYYRYDGNDNERFIIKLLYDNKNQKYQAVILEKRYDVVGRQIMEIGYYNAVPFDDINNFTYEKLVELMLQHVDLKDRKTYYILDELGQKRFIIDSENLIIENLYDLKGRLIVESKYAMPVVNPEVLAMQEPGQISIQKNPTEDRLSFTAFNIFDLPICTVDGEGNIKAYAYDKNKNLITLTDCKVAVTLSQFKDYDSFMSTVENIVFNLGAHNRNTYYNFDNLDQQQFIFDAISNKDEFIRNALGQVKQHIDRVGRLRKFVYDRAQRLILSTLCSVQLLKMSVDATLHLSETNETRDIQEYIEYDFCNNVIKIIKDYQHDERIVISSYTALNALQTIQIKNVQVNDSSKKANLNQLPTKTVDIQTQNVYDGRGVCVAKQKENGNWDFYVNDNLQRPLFILHQEEDGLSVIGFERNTFGEISKKTKYINRIKIDVDAYTLTGIPVEVILTTFKEDLANDRAVQFQRDHRGSIIEARKDKVFYYQPDSKQIEYTEVTSSYVNNIFGERKLIRRNRFPALEQLDTQIFKWNDRNGKPVAEAEAIQDLMTAASLDSGAVQFRITRWQYNSHGEKSSDIEFALPLTAAPTLETSLVTLDKLCQTSDKDRRITITYNELGKIDIELDETVPTCPTTKQYTYTAVEKIQSITYLPNGDGNLSSGILTEYRYYNAQNNEIRRVGFNNMVHQELGWHQNFAHALTFYGYNSHGEKVWTKRYAEGTVDAHNYPEPFAPDPTRDEVEKIFYNKRGLPLIKQDAENNITVSLYDLNKKISRQFWQLTSRGIDGTLSVEHIDEKGWVYDKRDRLLFSSYFRDGTQTLATQYQYNAFGECIGEGPGDGQFPLFRRFDQVGHLWGENSEKGIATINLFDLQGVPTGIVRSAKIDLSLVDHNSLSSLIVQGTDLEVTRLFPDMSKRLLCKIEPPISQENPEEPRYVPLTVEVNASHATRIFGHHSITWSAIPDTTLKMYLKLEQVDGYKSYPEIEVETYNGITGINVDRLNLPSDVYRYTVTYAHEILKGPRRRYQYQPQKNNDFNLADANQILISITKNQDHIEIHFPISLFNKGLYAVTEEIIAFERRRRIAFSRQRFAFPNILYLPILIQSQQWALLILDYEDKTIELKNVKLVDPTNGIIIPKILNALRDEALHPDLKEITSIDVPHSFAEKNSNSCIRMLEIAKKIALGNDFVPFSDLNIGYQALHKQHEAYLIQQSEVHPLHLQSTPVPELKKIYQSTGILHIDTDNHTESQCVVTHIENYILWLSGNIADITAIELWQADKKLNRLAVVWDNVRQKPYASLRSAKDNSGKHLKMGEYTIKAIRGEKTDKQMSLPFKIFVSKVQSLAEPIAQQIDFRAQMHWSGKHGELAIWDLPHEYAASKVKIICDFIDQDNHEHIFADIKSTQSVENEMDPPIFYVEIPFVQPVKSITSLTLSIILAEEDYDAETEILLYREEKPLSGDEKSKVTFIHEERIHTLHLKATPPHGHALRTQLQNSADLSPLDSEWILVDKGEEEVSVIEKISTIHFTPRTILHISPINSFLKNKELLYSHLSYLDSSAGFMAKWKQIPIFAFNKTGLQVDITLMNSGIYNYKLVTPEVADKIESKTYQFICSHGGQLFISEEKTTKNTAQVSPVWLYSYDVWDNKTKEQDPYGHVTQYEYNRFNKKTKTTFPPISVTDEQTHTESKVTTIINTYDPWGKKTGSINEKGIQEYFNIDCYGRIIMDNDRLQYNCYDVLGCKIFFDDSRDFRFSQKFDSRRNVISLSRQSHPAPAGLLQPNFSEWIKTYEYDQRSRRVLERDEIGYIHIYVYDERDNITSVINPFKTVSQITTYHRTNQPQTITYPFNSAAPDGFAADRMIILDYDYFGNLQNKILMNGAKVTFDLDFKKQIVGQTSLDESTRSQSLMTTRMIENIAIQNTLISEGRWYFSRSIKNHLNQNIIYEYENGLLKNVIDATQNQQTAYGYNLLKRRNCSIIQFSDGSRREMGCSFNPRGWQDTTHDSNATVQTGFDPVGNVRYQSYQFQSGTDICSGTLYSQYDDRNRVLIDQGVFDLGAIRLGPNQGVGFEYFARYTGFRTNFFDSEFHNVAGNITKVYFDYFKDGCLHTINAYLPLITREYYSNDLLYLYTENNKVAPFTEMSTYDANSQITQMNRSNGQMFLEKTEYSNRDRFGQYNQRLVYLADDSRTTFENDNYYFETPQIWQVRATTHLPDGTEKQLQPAQFFYDANRHPCGKISNNLVDELEKITMNVLTDSGAIVRKQHITTSTDHPAYGQITELAFMDPNENYFASYTLCDDPRDRGYNNLLHKYPDHIKGGGTAATSAKAANERFGSERAGQAMKFQILSPVENMIDYPTPVTFDEYKSFFGGDNPEQGFKNYIPSAMSTFPSNSPQSFVVPSNLNPGQTDMSLAEISQSRFGSSRYAAQIAAANGLPITARCKPGEHLSIPQVQMHSKSAYDNIPYQKIMSTLLGSLSPHLDHSQPHQSCVQVITSIVIDMVAEAIGMMMGNPLVGMLMAAGADAAMQEVAVQIGLLSQFSWVNVVEAGLDVGMKNLMNSLGPLDLFDEIIANASISSSKVISRQLTEMALGQRKQLDLKQVVTAIETSVIDSAIHLPQSSNPFVGRIENLFISGAQQIIGDVITGAPIDVKMIAANMVGQEIGSDLSGLIQQVATSPAKKSVLQAQKQTGINDKNNRTTGPQAQIQKDYLKSVARGQGTSEDHENTYTHELKATGGSELNDEWDLHQSVRSSSNKPAMSTNQNKPNQILHSLSSPKSGRYSSGLFAQSPVNKVIRNDIFQGKEQLRFLLQKQKITVKEYETVMAHSSNVSGFYQAFGDLYFKGAENFLKVTGNSGIARNHVITEVYATIAKNDPYAAWFALASLASEKVGEVIGNTSLSSSTIYFTKVIYKGLSWGNQRVFRDMVPTYEIYKDLGIKGLETIAKYNHNIYASNVEGYRLEHNLEVRGQMIAKQLGFNYTDPRVLRRLLSDQSQYMLFQKATFKLVKHEQKDLLQPMYDKKYSFFPHSVGYELTHHPMLAKAFGPSPDLIIGHNIVPLGNLNITKLNDRLQFVEHAINRLGQNYLKPNGYEEVQSSRDDIIGKHQSSFVLGSSVLFNAKLLNNEQQYLHLYNLRNNL